MHWFEDTYSGYMWDIKREFQELVFVVLKKEN